jgi:hypothetical protein
MREKYEARVCRDKGRARYAFHCWGLWKPSIARCATPSQPLSGGAVREPNATIAPVKSSQVENARVSPLISLATPPKSRKDSPAFGFVPPV